MNNKVTSQPMRLSFDCDAKMKEFRRVVRLPYVYPTKKKAVFSRFSLKNEEK